MSPARPSPPSQVYKPPVDNAGVEIRTSKKLTEHGNKLDNLKLRCDLADGLIIPLLKMIEETQPTKKLTRTLFNKSQEHSTLSFFLALTYFST